MTRSDIGAWHRSEADLEADPLCGLTTATREVLRFLESRYTLLVLTGDVGCGKSHAARAVSALYRHQYHEAKVAEMLRWPDWDNRLAQLQGCLGVLILDDIGVEREQRVAALRERLWLLVDQRGERNLKTVITTNLGVDELEASYSKRFVDRLIEFGGARGLVHCPEPSLRGEAKPEPQVWCAVDLCIGDDEPEEYVPTQEQWMDLYDRLRIGGLT